LGEKVLEIVIYLIRYLEENGGRFESIKDMAKDLREQGFTDNEINKAYVYILDQYRQPGFVIRSSAHSKSRFYRRILSDYERGFFTSEGYGALIQMKHLGIIDDLQLEMIIERATFSGQDKIDAAAVRSLAWSFIITNTQRDHSNFNPGYLDLDENTQIH
jgi:uncharacterized protein Smg (DUF494 family)